MDFTFLRLINKTRNFQIHVQKNNLTFKHCNAMLGLPVDNRFKATQSNHGIATGDWKVSDCFISSNFARVSFQSSRPSLTFTLTLLTFPPLRFTACWRAMLVPQRDIMVQTKVPNSLCGTKLNTHFGFRFWTSSRFLNLALKNCTSKCIGFKILNPVPNSEPYPAVVGMCSQKRRVAEKALKWYAPKSTVPGGALKLRHRDCSLVTYLQKYIRLLSISKYLDPSSDKSVV